MNSEDKKRWLKSLVISFIVYALFSVYLFLRRGYYDLYIINKVLGSSAAALAGLTLIIGPLSKISLYFARFMTIRRHLGLIALAFAILHTIASLSQMNRFTWFSWYIKEWIPVTFGILAILMWAYMTYLSRNSKIQQMGVDLWKKHLSLFGQLAFLSIFLHLSIMKYPGWIRWFQGQVKQSPELANPSFPPASIFVGGFMLFIIGYRIITFFKHERNAS